MQAQQSAKVNKTLKTFFFLFKKNASLLVDIDSLRKLFPYFIVKKKTLATSSSDSIYTAQKIVFYAIILYLS